MLPLATPAQGRLLRDGIFRPRCSRLPFLPLPLQVAVRISTGTFRGGTEETPTSITAGITITTENLIPHLEEIPAQAASGLISYLT